METQEITIVNGLKVTVPNVLNLMTPYVLKEQGDWFEDEIKFLRNYIKPGMRVIDIGANYGTYALTMAKLIGDSGRLWAFEPASATANCLEQSIKSNGLKNIKLIRAGLSNKAGTAKLYLSDNSELNSMTKEADQVAGAETIKLLTLDSCLNEYKWNKIDFIKLDAEGEESNILKKGKNTLASLSPLIMFELKHGNTVNQPLISKFNELGYDCYRLIPGLNVLVPFDKDDAIDGYLLNLFGCKKDKAIELEAEGFIVSDPVQALEVEEESGIERLKQFPYWEAFKEFKAGPDKSEYLRILNQYLSAQDKTKSSKQRLAQLMAALDAARKMLGTEAVGIEHITTFSRIAFDAGERSLGVDLLKAVINRYHQALDFEVREPVLPACQRYDDLVPQGKIKEWLFSSILEQYIKKSTFSSYFSRQNVLPLFQIFERLGFQNEDMKQRQALAMATFA